MTILTLMNKMYNNKHRAYSAPSMIIDLVDCMLLLRVGTGSDEIDEQLQIYVVENTSYRTSTLSSS